MASSRLRTLRRGKPLVQSLVRFLILSTMGWLSLYRGLYRGIRIMHAAEASSMNKTRMAPLPTFESPEHPPARLERIYYINLVNVTERRDYMESWLRRQSTPYERIEGVSPALNTTNNRDLSCLRHKSDPYECRGIRGLIASNIKIMTDYNTSGMTLVMEDDCRPRKGADANEFSKRVEDAATLVPDDWDIIRLDCGGHRPSAFVSPVSKTVFRTARDPQKSCGEGEICWFCSGTHAQVWRDASIHKLRRLWSKVPYDDIDCRLDSHEINSYCVNIGLVELRDFPSSIPKNRSIS